MNFAKQPCEIESQYFFISFLSQYLKFFYFVNFDL